MIKKQFVICMIRVTVVILEMGTSNRSDGLGMTGVWENTMRRWEGKSQWRTCVGEEQQGICYLIRD